MFCNKCGNKINNGEKFCNKCGNAVFQEQVQSFAPQSNAIPTPTPVSVPAAKKTMSKKAKTLIAGTSVAFVIIIVASVLLVNFILPPIIARNEIKNALDIGNYYYLQDVYAKYFGVVEYYETDSRLTTGGYVINSETDAISDELVKYFNSVTNDIESYDSDGIYIYLREQYGDIILDDERNSREIWEDKDCRYYVYPEVEEAYQKMNAECRSALGG